MTLGDYESVSATSLASAVRDRQTTIPQIIRSASERVAEIDDAGPRLASVLALNSEAGADAEMLQAESDSGARCSTLHGVPILIKDNIDTRGPLPTTAGSLALADRPAPRDSDIVARLRAAGLVIFGKANLSEWGNFRASRSTRGWSAVRGLVRNPHRLDRSAAGSSSGSAAAVAAGIVPLAIGTETDGSIIAPAAVTGIVGLKPTVGLISGRGIVPISRNQDTAGPMARTVREVALLLDVIAERGPHGFNSYVECCDHPDLNTISIGMVTADWSGVHPAALAAVDDAVGALARQGVHVVEEVQLPSATELAEADYELTVLLYDCKWDMADYLRERAHPGRRNLSDLIAFNRDHADAELCHFGQDLFERAVACGPRTEPAYLAALEAARRCGREEGIDYALNQSKVDCLIVPGFGPAWKSDLVYGDGPDLNHIATPAQAAAVAGYPLISVPAGTTGGLPVGVTLMGGAYSESTLLRLAQAIENGLDAHLTPLFSPPTTG